MYKSIKTVIIAVFLRYTSLKKKNEKIYIIYKLTKRQTRGQYQLPGVIIKNNYANTSDYKHKQSIICLTKSNFYAFIIKTKLGWMQISNLHK